MAAVNELVPEGKFVHLWVRLGAYLQVGWCIAFADLVGWQYFVDIPPVILFAGIKQHWDCVVYNPSLIQVGPQ